MSGRHRRRTATKRRTLLVAAAACASVLLLASTAISAPGSTPGRNTQGTGAKQASKPDPGEPPVWTGVPGTHRAHDEHGYPWPAAPDCNEGDVGTGSCVNDGRGFFQGQCTSWVAHRLAQRNGIEFHNWYEGRHWGNAVDWARVARRLGYRPNQVPAVGAIGWYARGHVSYVEEVNGDGSIVISEMNTDGHNGFHTITVVPGGAGWPDRFIHVADVVPVDLTPPARPAPAAATTLDRGVRLSWERPADDIGVTGYRVLRNGTPLAATTAPAYVDRQASAGQSYTYSIEAYDAAGNVSAPATVAQPTGVPAPDRLRGRLQEARLVETAATTAVCGLTGTRRDQRVACRIRTLDGWRTVRTGREVPWGEPTTRAFLASDDARIWFCRLLAGGRNACLPLDLAGPSWGFDRIGSSRPQASDATWISTPTGAARCGMAADRASCSVLTARGWKRPRTADRARPGDPLSRAFLRTGDGVAFCRNVGRRPSCTTLDPSRLSWGRTQVGGHDALHGRWVSRPAGPALCPVVGGSCNVVRRAAAVAAPADAR